MRFQAAVTLFPCFLPVSVGHQRRIVQLAQDWAHRRVAFGAPLSDKPAHARTLARMEVEARGNVQIVFDMVRMQVRTPDVTPRGLIKRASECTGSLVLAGTTMLAQPSIV